MRRQDEERNTVQGSGHAQWSVPDARRRKYWPTHRGGISAVDPGQLEARQILR
jgi:hypothetical protein